MKTLLAHALLACAISQGAVAGASPAVKLPPQDRAEFVLAWLDKREAELQNFSYSLEDTTWNTASATGQRRFIRRNTYELRRLGPKLWMHIIPYKGGSRTEIRSESIVNWDGKIGRGIGLPPYQHVNHAECRIDPFEHAVFSNRMYNEILGLRVQSVIGVNAGYLTCPEWLRQALQTPQASVRVDEDELKGVLTIRLTVSEDNREHKLWLDPDRGYLIMRHEYYIHQSSVWDRSSEEVLKAEQVDGIWVPKLAVRRVESSGYPEWSEITYDVKSFSIGNVTDRDVEVTFPTGSRVVDTVNHIAYFIQPGGNYRLIPLGERGAGILRVPPQQAIVSRPGAAAAKAYTEQRLVLAGAPHPNPRRLRYWVLALNGLLLAGVAGAFVVLRRRRRLAA